MQSGAGQLLEHSLALNLAEFSGFTDAVMLLAERLPERVTVAQITFFLLAGCADLAGRPETFTAIRDKAGSAINRSMHTTYKVFVEGGRRRDREIKPGLGWLSREEDPMDNRQKFLRLTPTGRKIMIDLLVTLKKHNTL